MLSQVFNICKKKIFRWYKEVLSGFNTEEIQKEIREFDTIDTSSINSYTKTPEIVLTPICKPENFGKNMCIDDKNLGDHGFTILSNLDTGKIAFMIQTRKAKIINEVLHKHVPIGISSQVEVLTKDLAVGYEQVRRESFIRATGVADKFHVIKLGLQSISDLRVKHRQAELTKERERQESHKCNESRNRFSEEQKRKHDNNKYKTKRCPPAQRMSNGETVLQILASSNRALSQLSSKWGNKMKKRMQILFQLFPDVQKIYNSICEFRYIYDAKEFGETPMNKAQKSIEKWLKKIGASEISELQNFAFTVTKHKGNILSYFKTGKTNAYAESLNAKLQRFLRDNFGIKNLDFFLWRIKKNFS